MIRVAIVDDEQLIRSGLRALLAFASDLVIVDEAVDGEDAKRLLQQSEIDVLLLDVRMPRLDGLGVLRWLEGRADSPAVVVLTTFDDAELLLQSVRAGARGFLPKDVSLEELLETIRAVAAGATRFQSAVTSSLRRAIDRSAPTMDAVVAEALTKREVEVLRMMASGLTNREISESLSTAEATVKNQVSSILSKLNARDRTRAVLIGLERGIV